MSETDIEIIIYWTNMFIIENIILEIINPISLEDFAFRVQLGKRLSAYETNPPHVKAGKMLRDEGFEIKQGDIIKYVITKKGAKPLQLSNIKEIDRNKYIDYLETMVGQILDAFNMSFDEIIGKPTQKTLNFFVK